MHATQEKHMQIIILLYPNFETLDVFGPVEIFGKVPDWNMQFYSLNGGTISNQDGVCIATESLTAIPHNIDTLFIPGGQGARTLIQHTDFINQLKLLAQKSQYVLTVCTGSALLATTGLLNGRRATSNKRAFDWVKTSSSQTHWVEKARWITDGKYYTSSGISAGMDMALAFVQDRLDKNTAQQIATRIEYHWQQDSKQDKFCSR
jgi:transcriptional regulator GlxA family with amidase domain